MKKGILKVATCQFAICGNPKSNGAQVRRQTIQAKRLGAQVAHFPECALSGYGGHDVKSWNTYDWEGLREQTRQICDLAARKRIWVVLGSSHQLSGNHKPHNCIYVINDRGRIIDRYDKRFCTIGDLKYYSPGDHFVAFTVNGVKCGCLICYDSRFPEMYREYKKLKVQLVFHSFYNARSPGRGILADIIPPTVKTRAASNNIWVSANNSSAFYQLWPSLLVQPDGITLAALERHRAGVMVNTVTTLKKYYDPAGPNRDRAMAGRFNSGKLVKDPRSKNRNRL